MISFTSFLICGVVGIVIYYLFNKNHGKNRIPGPFIFPLVGNLLSMGKLPHIKIAEWAEKYGKIFQVAFGPYKCVVLADPKLVRDTFNDPLMSGRVDLESFHAFAGGKHGVISSDGPEWVEQRRFTLRSLRDYGFGKNTMETLIVEEVNEYLDFLKRNEGNSVSVVERFSLAVLNSLWMIIASVRFPQDDPKLVALFEQNKKLSEETSNSPAMMLPSLAKMIPELSGWNSIQKFLEATKANTRSHIAEHKRTFNEDEVPRDFIDIYLKEIRETKDPNSSFYKDAGDVSLLAVIQDLFFAGSDTTASTLSWIVLYLSKFPQAQQRLQAELDSVIGKNRRPNLADRPSLIYTEAVILEGLRMSSLTPLGVFHATMADVKLCGYDIPKGTWLAPAEHYLHYSKAHWDEPELFKPERHMTSNGKELKSPKNEAFMPFSTGKRQCLGQSLALDTTFMFLTNIYQRFEISLSPESKDATLDPKPGFTLSPKEFKVVVKERF